MLQIGEEAIAEIDHGVGHRGQQRRLSQASLGVMVGVEQLLLGRCRGREALLEEKEPGAGLSGIACDSDPVAWLRPIASHSLSFSGLSHQKHIHKEGALCGGDVSSDNRGLVGLKFLDKSTVERLNDLYRESTW